MKNIERKLLKTLEAIAQSADEYAEAGRDFPTFGAGNIGDIARAAIKDAEEGS